MDYGNESDRTEDKDWQPNWDLGKISMGADKNRKEVTWPLVIIAFAVAVVLSLGVSWLFGAFDGTPVAEQKEEFQTLVVGQKEEFQALVAEQKEEFQVLLDSAISDSFNDGEYDVDYAHPDTMNIDPSELGENTRLVKITESFLTLTPAQITEITGVEEFTSEFLVQTGLVGPDDEGNFRFNIKLTTTKFFGYLAGDYMYVPSSMFNFKTKYGTVDVSDVLTIEVSMLPWAGKKLEVLFSGTYTELLESPAVAINYKENPVATFVVGDVDPNEAQIDFSFKSAEMSKLTVFTEAIYLTGGLNSPEFEKSPASIIIISKKDSKISTVILEGATFVSSDIGKPAFVLLDGEPVLLGQIVIVRDGRAMVVLPSSMVKLLEN